MNDLINMKHFTLKELTKSETAEKFSIDNTPDSLQLKNLRLLVEKVLDPAREGINAPIKINSGFRSFLLNQKVGGSKTSQHMGGKAADITCFSNKKLFEFIKNNLPFDQLIKYEKSGRIIWIHVSYDEMKNRKQTLTINLK